MKIAVTKLLAATLFATLASLPVQAAIGQGQGTVVQARIGDGQGTVVGPDLALRGYGQGVVALA